MFILRSTLINMKDNIKTNYNLIKEEFLIVLNL